MTLRAAPGSDAGQHTQAQADKAVDELDETVKLLRSSVFDSQGTDGPPGHSVSVEADPDSS